MEERQRKVLGQILWFPRQPKAPITYNGENVVRRIATSFLIGSSSIKLAGNEDSHKISDEFDFGTDWTIHFGVTHP